MKSRRNRFIRHFFVSGFPFTIWTFTPGVPKGILSSDSRTAEGPGVKSCGLGQTMSGVIVAMRRTLLSCTSLARNGLIAAGHGGMAACRAGLCQRPCFRRDHRGLARSRSPGIRDPGHRPGAARLFRGGGDPADAHPDPRCAQRGGAAFRTRRSAGAGRPPARAVIRRTSDPDLVARGRQSTADQRRHLAVADARPAAAAHSRIWNLAAAGAGAADGSRGRRAARGRRRIPDQSDHVERTCPGGDGPRHRRPGHCADS